MKKKYLAAAVLPLTAMLCCSTGAAAYTVPSDDTVTSQKIREADGTSGQNTNSGAGVKTGHIQDGAVTDAKISNVAMDKVIGLAEAIAAIPAGPEGPMGPAGPAGPMGPAGPAAVYGNITVVALEGGEYTSPVEAINDLSNWCGAPAATNPCLVKIMPGVYNIGTTPLVLQAYVAAEGSGEDVTRIVGAPQNTNSGVVNLSAGASLRNLTVQAQDTPAAQYWNTGVVVSTGPVALTDVTALALGGGGTERSIAIQLKGDATLRNVTASASGSTIHHTGILSWAKNVTLNGVNISVDNGQANYAMWLYSAGSTPTKFTMKDVTVLAGGGHSNSMGIYAYQYSSGGYFDLTITNSSFAAPGGSAIYVNSQDPATTLNVAHSMLEGVVYSGGSGAVPNCVGIYDSGFQPISCQ